MDAAAIAAGVRELLTAVGEDAEREGLRDTPKVRASAAGSGLGAGAALHPPRRAWAPRRAACALRSGPAGLHARLPERRASHDARATRLHRWRCVAPASARARPPAPRRRPGGPQAARARR